MEKVFKHRKTGEIAYYKDGILKSGNCSIEIGREPSSDIWEKSFITEDGEIKFCGDNVAWYIAGYYKYMLTLHENHTTILDNKDSCYKIFSSEAQAKAYEEKHRQPVLTTVDGVDLYEGDTYYCVNSSFNIYKWVLYKNLIQENVKIFSSEIAAKNYLKENEKKYSLNDIKEGLQNYLYSSFERNKVKEYVLKYLENNGK